MVHTAMDFYTSRKASLSLKVHARLSINHSRESSCGLNGSKEAIDRCWNECLPLTLGQLISVWPRLLSDMKSCQEEIVFFQSWQEARKKRDGKRETQKMAWHTRPPKRRHLCSGWSLSGSWCLATILEWIQGWRKLTSERSRNGTQEKQKSVSITERT